MPRLERQTGGKDERERERGGGGGTGRQTDRWTDRQNDGQTDRQRHGQTEQVKERNLHIAPVNCTADRPPLPLYTRISHRHIQANLNLQETTESSVKP